MSSHLLIVGQYTYPVHRERLLTGSGSLKIPFQNSNKEQILGLCKDFARVGVGDRIYFYVVKDGDLQATRKTLLNLYNRLFNEKCAERRSKITVINAIKQHLVGRPDAEEALLRAIEEEEQDSSEELPKKTYRYLLEILGNPEPLLSDGFYGIFTVIEEPYLMQYSREYEREKNVYGRGEFVRNMINNYLWMRIKVKPKMLFPTPISEFELLDDFSDEVISWTLIYRKLFGGRSCTSVPPVEEQKILRLLNNRNPSILGNTQPDYNVLENRVMSTLESGGVEFIFEPIWDNNRALGAISVGDYVKNLNNSNADNLLSEDLLEANILYELTNLSRNEITISPNVKDKFRELLNFPQEEITWIGNQVVCSAGNSTSDIVSFHGPVQTTLPTSISVIELKNVALESDNIRQVGKYARWLSSTYLNRKIDKVRHVLIGWSKDKTLDPTIIEAVRNGGFPFPVNILTYHLDNFRVVLTRHL